MLNTILFDLDDTLLDFKQAQAQALWQTLLRLDIPPSQETVALYSAINQSQWELLEQGRITRQALLLRRFDILFQHLGVTRSSREAQAVYETLLGQGHDYLPGAQALLETLQSQYRLYLVSNGTLPVQRARLQGSGAGRYFRDIFLSEEVGFDKPAKAFFDHCFAAIPDFSREAAVIVGDSLTSDILGGNNAGIRTCWFNPSRRPRDPAIHVDVEFTALSQLPVLLRQL